MCRASWDPVLGRGSNVRMCPGVIGESFVCIVEPWRGGAPASACCCVGAGAGVRSRADGGSRFHGSLVPCVVCLIGFGCIGRHDHVRVSVGVRLRHRGLLPRRSLSVAGSLPFFPGPPVLRGILERLGVRVIAGLVASLNSLARITASGTKASDRLAQRSGSFRSVVGYVGPMCSGPCGRPLVPPGVWSFVSPGGCGPCRCPGPDGPSEPSGRGNSPRRGQVGVSVRVSPSRVVYVVSVSEVQPHPPVIG